VIFCSVTKIRRKHSVTRGLNKERHLAVQACDTVVQSMDTWQSTSSATWQSRSSATWQSTSSDTWQTTSAATCLSTSDTVANRVGSLTELHLVTKTEPHQWWKRFVTEWIPFSYAEYFVIEWMSFSDENMCFVTVVNQWRSFNDELVFVTSSSQNNFSDDFRASCDEGGPSLMSTSLIVGRNPLDIGLFMPSYYTLFSSWVFPRKVSHKEFLMR
jgi:hypothetical protein